MQRMSAKQVLWVLLMFTAKINWLESTMSILMFTAKIKWLARSWRPNSEDLFLD